MSIKMENFSEFFDYTESFYGVGGLYDMGVPRLAILTATFKLILDLGATSKFVGDSVDREKVRDILMDEMGYKFPTLADRCIEVVLDKEELVA